MSDTDDEIPEGIPEFLVRRRDPKPRSGREAPVRRLFVPEGPGSSCWNGGILVDGRDPAAAESPHQEFRQAGDPDTVTRDELKADDWHVAGLAVEYRNHGPTDEFPGPWRAYGGAAGTGEG